MTSRIDIIQALFGGSGRTAILRLLAEQTAPLTGRQVAALTGLSPAGASRALEHLSRLGVVSRRRVGRAVTHELERESAIVQTIVMPAIEAEAQLLSDMVSELSRMFADHAESVVLYGSVGRGEPEVSSDVDVLDIVSDEAAAKDAMQVADEAGHAFFQRFGMPLSLIVVAVRDLPKKPRGFLNAALGEGILVAGRPLAEMLHYGPV
jgi:predicted nucleotidyltransferase